MSALSFKINAETDKLKSFITMLERLRQVLAEIPDSTKEFDVINRKIGEMEARVEQAMRKIAQMEQQAMDAASKAAASATTGTAGDGSTAGTAATQAETAAYHDLLSELKAANDEKTKAIAQIRLYSNEIARLKADVTALNKEEQQNGQLSAKKRAQVLDAAVSIEEYKQEISQLKRELANHLKLEKAAVGSINEMSQALTRMRAVYKNLSTADREGRKGKRCLKTSNRSTRRSKNWMRRWASILAMSAIMPRDSICWDSKFSKLPASCRHWHMARKYSLPPYPTTCRCWPMK